MTPNENIQEACTALAKAVTQLVTALWERSALDAPSPADAIEHEDDAGSVGPPIHAPDQPGPRSTHRIGQARSGAAEAAASERRLYVYMAGARGLADLTRARGRGIVAALGLTVEPYIVKCGTTTIPLEARLQQIGQDRYGAAVRTTDGVVVEPGFTRWIAHAIATSRQPRDHAMTLLPRAVAIELPEGLTRRAFDGALHRALKARALDGLPACVAPKRYVAYDLVETRLNAAKEFYALSPHVRGDGDLLLEAVEGILRRFRAAKA